jgi:methionyl-tRNA formyltransferase
LPRAVYLGTSAFAAEVLERISDAGERPALVVTRPDRPRGRGRRLASPPVADTARTLGIAVAQPGSVNSPEALETIAAADPEVVCVCAFGALIREPLLSRYEMLNVHPSLLPRWRGAAPIERAIMAGDSETGVSIMRLGEGLDDGPMCLAASVPIGPDDTYGTLSDRLAPLSADLLVRALRERPPFREQDDAAATYAEKITPDDRQLDPARPAPELERVVRALEPHIGAQVELPDGGRLGVHASRVIEAQDLSPDGARLAEAAADGRLFAEGDRLFLRCSPGTLELMTVQPAGGRPMDAAAYLRGHRSAVAG